MAEEAEPDTASWVEVQVTSMFTAATMAVFVVIFEFSRRNPAVAAVFDRRRPTKPNRTPPPLIRSRYFEWLFLSTDPAYSEYAEMTHTRAIIKERKRQQAHAGTWYNINNKKPAEKVGVITPIVEEEEPGKRRKKHEKGKPSSSKVASGKGSPQKVQEQREKRIRFHPSLEQVNTQSSSDDESSSSTSSGTSTDEELDMAERGTKGRKGGEKAILSSSTLSTDVTDDTGDRHIASVHSHDDDGVEMVTGMDRDDSHRSAASAISTTSSGKGRKHRKTRSHVAKYLTPDVVVVNGRRLPASIAEYAIAGDLTEEQLDDYEHRLMELEREEERLFRERQRELKRQKQAGRKRNSGTPDKSDRTNTQTDRTRQFKEHGREEGDEGWDERLDLPSPNRWGYIGTRQGSGGLIGRLNPFGWGSSSDLDGSDGSSLRGSGILTRCTSSSSGYSSSSPMKRKEAHDCGHYVNRHLKAAAVTSKRPLSIADGELLRCIGLDSYVMIRFLRFGFDTTFYPFILACLVLVPTYYTSPYEGEVATDETDAVETGGYFRVTMNRLEPGSARLWIAWGFGIVFFVYVLRRLWVEWVTFIALRFDFLANGDVEPDQGDSTTSGSKHSSRGAPAVEQKDDAQLHLQQYRNSCMVEYIPESHRRDKELFEFYNAVFPNQVKRAEILLNATTLTKLIAERQGYIEKYENIYAKHFHAKQAYRKKMESHHDEDAGICQYVCCRCLGVAPKRPQEPKVKIDNKCLCCGKKMVKALPYYLSEIKRLNRAVEDEHRRILAEKQNVEDKEDTHGFVGKAMGTGMKFVTGSGGELKCNVGFVEFKNLTAKQSALQCNITGTTEFMVTTSAPDPRDIVWDNATVERATIKVKKMQCDALLFTGTLFWSVVVTGITSISNLDKWDDWLPDWLIPEPGSFWYGLIQGYLPVLLLELFMWLLTLLFRFIAEHYVRFKSKSEVDKFVFIWHFAYRVTNLLIIIVSGSLSETLDSLRTSPETFINDLASGIANQSQFFLNNMIVAAGTENLWELAQVPNMFVHFMIHKVITVEAKSKRSLEKLEEPDRFEWGEVVPPFIFAFLVAAVYCVMVPIVIGVCAVFFYIATKVYTHQALFVYAQPYEGGGKLMYLLNRTVFVLLYIAISIFATVLGLRGGEGVAFPLLGPSFFFITILLTIFVDIKIQQKFVKPSITLALTNARIVDEDNKRKEERARRYKEYKAAKLERRREAAKAAREKGKHTAKSGAEDGESSTKSAQESSSSGMSGETTPSDPRKKIQFRVTKEESPDQLRERQAAKTAAAKARAGANQFGLSLSDKKGKGDEDDGKFDFYLYRQPSLNKSLWETKPRPYR